MARRYPSPEPSRNLRMAEAARLNMLITLHCNVCGRTTCFLATDLLRVLGPQHEVHRAPFDCGRCKTTDYIRVEWEMLTASRLASGLTLRRPVKQITKWIWRNEQA